MSDVHDEAKELPCPGDAMVGAILCGCGPCVCKTNPVVDLATMIMDSLI